MSILSLAAALVLAAPAVSPQLVTRADPAALGQQLDGNIVLSIRSLSSDGRVVVYGSEATNVVPGDSNGVRDTYAYDRSTQVAQRVSLSPDGGQFTYETFQPSVSGNGEWALFTTYGLIYPPGGFGLEEVGEAWMKNLATGEQIRLGEPAVTGFVYRRARRPFANQDATLVSFYTNARLDPSDTNSAEDVYLYRRTSGTYQWLSKPRVAGATERGAINSAISDDGALVAFESSSDGLVPGDADGTSDVFVYEPALDRIRRVRDIATTAIEGGTFHPSLSRNGRWLVFVTSATNLPGGSGTYRIDLLNGALEQVVAESQPGGNWRGRAVTDDGRVLFESFFGLVANDTNSKSDIYLWQQGVPELRRMSAGVGMVEGDSGAPSVLADGSEVLFRSGTRFVTGDTNRFEDAYVRPLADGAPITLQALRSGPFLPARLTGGSDMGSQAISADGRYIAFHSMASNLVAGDDNDATDVFLRDRLLGTTRRISVDAVGAQLARGARCASISADGHFAAFVTAGASFGDVQDRPVALRVALTDGAVAVGGATRWDAWNPESTETCPVLSGDGRYLVFGSSADLVGGWNGVQQIYIRDFTTGAVERLSTRAGAAGGAASSAPSITADGSHVAFQSDASLVPADQDQQSNVYLWTRGQPGLRLAPFGANDFSFPRGPSVARNPNGDALVAFVAATGSTGLCTSSNTSSTYVWNVAAASLACASDGLPYISNNVGVTAVSFSPQGDWLAIAANACSFGGGVCALTFVRDMARGSYVTASMRADGLFSGGSYAIAVANDGMAVLSSSGYLHPDDNSPFYDIYAVDASDFLFVDGFE